MEASDDYSRGYREGWDKSGEVMGGDAHAIGIPIIIVVALAVGFLIGWYA